MFYIDQRLLLFQRYILIWGSRNAFLCYRLRCRSPCCGGGNSRTRKCGLDNSPLCSEDGLCFLCYSSDGASTIQLELFAFSSASCGYFFRRELCMTIVLTI